VLLIFRRSRIINLFMARRGGYTPKLAEWPSSGGSPCSGLPGPSSHAIEKPIPRNGIATPVAMLIQALHRLIQP
jgi:hypothetical protein